MSDDVPHKYVIPPTPEGGVRSRVFAKGNPGRPKGSRNKLGEDFIRAMSEDFDEHGKSVIKTVREKMPDQYLRVVASLLPKVVEVKPQAWEQLDDDELAAIIAAARAAVAISEGRGGGTSESDEPQPPGDVPPLH